MAIEDLTGAARDIRWSSRRMTPCALVTDVHQRGGQPRARGVMGTSFTAASSSHGRSRCESLWIMAGGRRGASYGMVTSIRPRAHLRGSTEHPRASRDRSAAPSRGERSPRALRAPGEAHDWRSRSPEPRRIRGRQRPMLPSVRACASGVGRDVTPGVQPELEPRHSVALEAPRGRVRARWPRLHRADAEEAHAAPPP
jgi:hypothetical protein